MADLSDISKALADYTMEVSEAITESAIELGNDGVKSLKSEPKTNRTGAYNKGWSKKVTKGANFINVKIFNKKHYRLTHLLEKGHATKNGGRTKAIPHIAPVEQILSKDFEQEVAKIIKNGGR